MITLMIIATIRTILRIITLQPMNLLAKNHWNNVPCERCGVMYKDHPYSKENQ